MQLHQMFPGKDGEEFVKEVTKGAWHAYPVQVYFRLIVPQEHVC